MIRPPRNEDEVPIWRRFTQDVLTGKRPRPKGTWTDVYPSSISVGVAGANVPQFNGYNGNLKAYEFVGTTNMKEINMGFQFPHSREDNSLIVPHIHIYAPSDGSGGVVKFGCEYTWTYVGQTGVVSTTTVYGTTTLAASTVYNNQIISFGEITSPSTNGDMSSIFMCRIFRDPSDVADTFGSSVWLKSADIHAYNVWDGSQNQYTR